MLQHPGGFPLWCWEWSSIGHLAWHLGTSQPCFLASGTTSDTEGPITSWEPLPQPWWGWWVQLLWYPHEALYRAHGLTQILCTRPLSLSVLRGFFSSASSLAQEKWKRAGLGPAPAVHCAPRSKCWVWVPQWKVPMPDEQQPPPSDALKQISRSFWVHGKKFLKMRHLSL